jgi:prefoldin subunit 5
METYYSKKEYNDMKKLLERKIQMLEKQNKKLMDKIQKQNEFIALITQ